MSQVMKKRKVRIAAKLTGGALGYFGFALPALRSVSTGVGQAVKGVRRYVDSRSKPLTIEPLVAVREAAAVQGQKIEQLVGEYRLPEHEAYKVAQLLTIEQSDYRLDDPSAVEAQLGRLSAAASLDEARQVVGDVHAALETEHRRVFENRLTLACEQAALKTGFRQLETSTSPLGTLRVIARDDTGRALVTEISDVDKDAPRIDTEVVGVSDNSCEGILDRFDEALEEEGVRSAPPSRTSTGGISQLAAAKEFMHRTAKRLARKRQPHRLTARTGRG